MLNFSQLEEKLKAGYNATSAGKFTDALKFFLSILHTIPLIVVDSRREVDEVKELIVIVKEYVLGLQMELKRREIRDDPPVRQQELAAYFTHCNLQLPHLRLALQSAMTACYKAKNLATAANFARRLLETNPTVENQKKLARQVLQAAEKNMTDAFQLTMTSEIHSSLVGQRMYQFTEDRRMSLALTVAHGLCQAKKGSSVLFVILQWLAQMLQGCYILHLRFDNQAGLGGFILLAADAVVSMDLNLSVNW